MEKHIDQQRKLFKNVIDINKYVDKVLHDGLLQYKRPMGIHTELINIIHIEMERARKRFSLD